MSGTEKLSKNKSTQCTAKSCMAKRCFMHLWKRSDDFSLTTLHIDMVQKTLAKPCFSKSFSNEII